jgi:hypothetical protein
MEAVARGQLAGEFSGRLTNVPVYFQKEPFPPWGPMSFIFGPRYVLFFRRFASKTAVRMFQK